MDMTDIKQDASKMHWYDMVVKEIVRVTPRAVALTLEANDPKIQLYFQAGQYLNVRLDIDKQEYCRSYSISSAPYEEVIVLTVQSIDGGVVSNYINKKIKPGDVMLCSQPVGKFVLHNSSRPKLFFSAGSGITPIFSMIKNHLYHSDQPCYLYYFNRNNNSTIFKNEISSLCSIYSSRLYIIHWHSEVCGRYDFNLSRLRLFDQIKELVPDVYICGPTEWMQRIKQAISVYKFGLGSIHTENFVADNDIDNPVAVSDAIEMSYKISLKINDTNYMFDARNTESLLEALRRNTVPITSGCEMGKCGSCMARVVSGDVKTNTINFLTQEEISEGYILCCQTQANSDCRLEV